MKSILLFTMGGTEWLLIALVVLLLFGGKKIPELMKGLGKGINEFKKGKNESEEKSLETIKQKRLESYQVRENILRGRNRPPYNYK